MTDPEIVKLAAEKVMGWVHRPCSSDERFQMWEFARPDACNVFASPHALTGGQWWPLTSIADAFMLVDAAAMPCDFTLERSGANWTADFRTATVTHADRCRSIVLAALKAVGVEIEEPTCRP